MRWDTLYVAGLGSYLPQQVYTTEQAVADGRYGAKVRTMCGYQAVRIAGEEEGPAVMAAAAGREALQRSGHQPDEIGLVLHAYVGHQGRDIWSPASYVQHETVGGNAPAFEVRQGCNGGLSAVELAASHLAARPDVTAALVTAGDWFHLPFIDRWTADEQMVFGDGAGAIVLSSRGGFARLRSTCSAGDPTLEELDRGSGPWTTAPFVDGKPLDLSARKRDYFAQDEYAFETVIERISETASLVMGTALEDGCTDLEAVRFFVHTTFPETIAQASVYGPLDVDRSGTPFDWALGLGQLGAADQLVGMTHLAETARPEPGDLLVASGVGAGHVWTVAVLEFLESPRW